MAHWRRAVLVVGFAAGDIPKIPLNLALLKSCSIVGVFWGAFATREPEAFARNTQTLIDWAVAGKVKPHVSARFPLAKGPEAIRVLAERQALGKILVEL